MRHINLICERHNLHIFQYRILDYVQLAYHITHKFTIMSKEGKHMVGAVDDLVLDVGAKSLSAIWKREGVISDNISNGDTPGYVAKSVSFEDQLSGAIADGRLTSSELSGVNPVITESVSGSGVDMEQQIIEMMRDQLQYNYLERGVSDHLSLLKTAVSEGRK